MKKTLFVLGLALLFVPFLVQAVTPEELRVQIQALLAQIASLQSQAQSQPAPVYTPPPSYIGTTPTTTGGTFQYSRCPDLQYNLERGDTDAATAVEVTMLQRFLAQDSTLYPEGQITGVFGPATERAVQRFQNRHGIVSYGDYQATGYGRVGPRTRWAIKNSCGAQSQPFEVAPAAGTAPLKVTVAFQGSGSNCTSHVIDWGDGTASASYNAPTPQSCLNDTFERTVTHTYTRGGVFTLTFRMGATTAALTPIVGSVPITVSEGSVSYPGTYVPPVQPVTPPVEDFSTCFVSPRSGSAPLTSRARVVLGGTLCDGRFSYQIDWGDGTLSEARSCSATASHYDTFTHNYNTPGSYTARLLQTHPQAFFNEETCAVSVSSAGTGVSGSYGAVAPPTCAQWYDGCNNCSRSYAGGPATCTLRACTQYTALQCYQYFGTSGTPTTQDSLSVSGRSSGTTAETITFGLVLNGARSCSGGLYVVDFGDGTYDQQPFPADACTAFNRTVSHTYTTNGIYTVRLIKDSATQATIQVQIASIIARSLEKNMAAVFEAVKSIVSHFIQ